MALRGLAFAMGALGAAAFVPASVVHPYGSAGPLVSSCPSLLFRVAGAGEPVVGLSAGLSGPAGRPRGSAFLPDPRRVRSVQRHRAPSMAASSAGVPSVASLAKQGAQVGVGVLLMFAVERALWATSKATGVWIPTAPAGMLLVFVMLLVIHAMSPKTAGAIKDWFTPARTFYSKGVPIFFSPPLVQLPLALSAIPLLSIAKYVSVVAVGTIVSIIATGLAADALRRLAQPPAVRKILL